MSKRKIVLVALVSIASFAVVSITMCGGILYLGYSSVETNASPKIDSMFDAIESDSFAETYQTQTTKEFRQLTTKEQYESIGEAIRTKLGNLRSKSLQGFTAKRLVSGSRIDASYSAVFDRDKATIIAKLDKEDGEWKFNTFRVESAAFKQND